jgi:hypothetical protein
MTIFGSQTLLISLPGKSVEYLPFPGSFIDPDQVLEADVPIELRLAFHLITEEALDRRITVRCIVRPELFSHGQSEVWLREHITTETQHLCLSDGTTVKPIRGIPTHVFFYRRSFRDSMSGLRKLSLRAPELFADIQTQVNSCFTLGSGFDRVRPASVF